MYSNNPFVENSDPSSRYPDLRQGQQQPQQLWQGNAGGYSPMVSPGVGQMGQMGQVGIPAQQGYQMQGGYQQPVGAGYGFMAGVQVAQPTGVGMSMGVAYQPTSSFGQNVVRTVKLAVRDYQR
jgi:hypothetical protein